MRILTISSIAAAFLLTMAFSDDASARYRKGYRGYDRSPGVTIHFGSPGFYYYQDRPYRYDRFYQRRGIKGYRHRGYKRGYRGGRGGIGFTFSF